MTPIILALSSPYTFGASIFTLGAICAHKLRTFCHCLFFILCTIWGCWKEFGSCAEPRGMLVHAWRRVSIYKCTYLYSSLNRPELWLYNSLNVVACAVTLGQMPWTYCTYLDPISTPPTIWVQNLPKSAVKILYCWQSKVIKTYWTKSWLGEQAVKDVDW